MLGKEVVWIPLSLCVPPILGPQLEPIGRERPPAPGDRDGPWLVGLGSLSVEGRLGRPVMDLGAQSITSTSKGKGCQPAGSRGMGACGLDNITPGAQRRGTARRIPALEANPKGFTAAPLMWITSYVVTSLSFAEEAGGAPRGPTSAPHQGIPRLETQAPGGIQPQRAACIPGPMSPAWPDAAWAAGRRGPGPCSTDRRRRA